MIIQRYLLFKNFIFNDLGYQKKDCELYISLIFHLLNNENLESLYENYVLSDDDKVEFKIDGKTYTEKKNDYLILIKYAEMVSPF